MRSRSSIISTVDSIVTVRGSISSTVANISSTTDWIALIFVSITQILLSSNAVASIFDSMTFSVSCNIVTLLATSSTAVAVQRTIFQTLSPGCMDPPAKTEISTDRIIAYTIFILLSLMATMSLYNFISETRTA